MSENTAVPPESVAIVPAGLFITANEVAAIDAEVIAELKPAMPAGSASRVFKVIDVHEPKPITKHGLVNRTKPNRKQRLAVKAKAAKRAR